MTRFENVGVFMREKFEPLARAIFVPNLFPFKYSNNLKSSHSPYLPAYEDGTDGVPKCRHIKFRHQGVTQKKAHNIQNMENV